MKDHGTLTIFLEGAGEDWQLSFADSGPGMTPQMTEKIFEPFQSQFEGGTGLGLAIVYQIVQAHDGKVFARSKPGQGCTFVLRIRQAAEEGMSFHVFEGAKLSESLTENSAAEGAHA
jgi:signal transduction histidine kinase